jgi:hypothetical protein
LHTCYIGYFLEIFNHVGDFGFKDNGQIAMLKIIDTLHKKSWSLRMFFLLIGACPKSLLNNWQKIKELLFILFPPLWMVV